MKMYHVRLSRGRALGLILLCCTVLPAPQITRAQDAPPTPARPDGSASRVILDWEQFKQIVNWDEQPVAQRDKITVSWQELQDLFGIKVENVESAELQLPWREFRKLLEWSLKRDAADAQGDAPAPALITAAEYVSEEIGKDGALFTARFKIQIFQEQGWKKIPLINQQLAIREAELPAGSYLHLDGDYNLITQASGALEATVKFAVRTHEAEGVRSLFFHKANAASNLLEVTVPEPNADVRIPNAQSLLKRPVEGGTRVIAALPAGSEVQVRWERAIPEPEKVPPKIFSEARTLITVAADLLFGQAQLTFNILHTPVRELALNVPAGVSVLEVLGGNIRDWRVKDGVLAVQLDRERVGAYDLIVKYEAAQQTAGRIDRTPVLSGRGVEREKGHVAVTALTNVEIQPGEVRGAHVIDIKDLPPAIYGMTSQPVLLAFRYVEPQFAIGLNINRHEGVATLLTAVDRAVFTVMQTVDGRRIVKAIYHVRNNRNQFLRLQMPAGAEIWSATVAGKPSQPALDAEGRTLLPLVRSQGLGGFSSFPVELVYVEQDSAPDARGRGSARVELPTCAEPVTHLMVNLYVPESGRYENFAGTLRRVEQFHQFQSAAQQQPEPADAAAQELQHAYVQQQAQQVQSAGGTQVEVSLPVSGLRYKLEKILVVREPQWFGYSYSRLK